MPRGGNPSSSWCPCHVEKKPEHRGRVNGVIVVRNVLAIHSCSRVTVKFDNIDEPYDVTRVKTRFCVLKHFYIHRQQFPFILAYAVTIHRARDYSLIVL